MNFLSSSPLYAVAPVATAAATVAVANTAHPVLTLCDPVVFAKKEEGPVDVPLAGVAWSNRIIKIQRDRLSLLSAIACGAVQSLCGTRARVPVSVLAYLLE